MYPAEIVPHLGEIRYAERFRLLEQTVFVLLEGLAPRLPDPLQELLRYLRVGRSRLA